MPKRADLALGSLAVIRSGAEMPESSLFIVWQLCERSAPEDDCYTDNRMTLADPFSTISPQPLRPMQSITVRHPKLRRLVPL